MHELNGGLGEVKDYYGFTLLGVYFDDPASKIITPYMLENGLSQQDVLNAYNTSQATVGIEAGSTLDFDCE